MKKFLLAILAICVIGFFPLSSVIAQTFDKPNDCCKLRHSLGYDENGTLLDSGTIIIEPVLGQVAANLAGKNYDDAIKDGNIWCDLDKDGKFDVGKYVDSWAMFCVIDTAMAITDWIFYILMLAAVIMIIVSAIVFMTSAGAPAKTELAQKMLIFAIVGLVVGTLAKLIPSIVRFFLGM